MTTNRRRDPAGPDEAAAGAPAKRRRASGAPKERAPKRAAAGSPKSRSNRRNRKLEVEAKAKPRAKRETTAPRVSARERLASVRRGAVSFAARLRRPFELLARAVVVVAIGVGAVALGRLVERHVRTSPAFALSELSVDGHVRITEAEILRTAGLELGQNVFDVAPEEAERALLDHPWIAEATVVRRLPASYQIEVRERRAVALLALREVFLVGEDGAVFKTLSDGDPVDLPVITGVDRDRFTRDRGFRTSMLLEVVALLHDYRGAGLWRREPLQEIHLETDDGLSLYAGEGVTYVRLGHGPFREKLQRLRTVLDELGSRGASAEYVYLDNERRPDRVTVRLRDVDEPGAVTAAEAGLASSGSAGG